MKKIIIKNEVIGSGIRYIGWSGRGWADGGPIGAGPLNRNAPSWDSYSQEMGINMVRMGFSIKHFLSEPLNDLRFTSDQMKKGLENREESWAKSEQTSYSYAIRRCCDLGWKILICINPSYRSPWNPSLITPSSPFLEVWKAFCFSLSKSIDSHWPGMAEYFEISNEPDIGYFDGESYLPLYQGPSGGITPSQYSLLFQNASEGIRQAVPNAKIIGPGLASWSRPWIEKVLKENHSSMDGLSYHNVCGHLKDEEILIEAKSLLSQYAPQAEGGLFNSEWAWWPNHDINSHGTALRIAQILYYQTSGNAKGSLYLGPAQPKGFKKGLGVIRFLPDDPNSIEKTKTFFAFRLMVRGVSGGKRLGLTNPLKKLKVMALMNDRKELVMTIINPNKKRFRNVSIDIDETINLGREPSLKFYQLDAHRSDHHDELDHQVLTGFPVEPESITQFIIPAIHQY